MPLNWPSGTDLKLFYQRIAVKALPGQHLLADQLPGIILSLQAPSLAGAEVPGPREHPLFNHDTQRPSSQ
jgi:hypothetical protein